ncbi:MAG: BrnT family toxin [bacterium]
MAKRVGFEWDGEKSWQNLNKHGVSFGEAQQAFADRNRVILRDYAHSRAEERFYCVGKVGNGIMAVRFTYRENTIRIFGAGYWRKGKKIYEKQNQKKN